MRLKKLKTAKASLQRALDIERYQLNYLSTKYKTEVLKRIARQVDNVKVVLGSKGFNHSDPITILSLIADLHTAFNNAAVHEGAAVWIMSYFHAKTPHH